MNRFYFPDKFFRVQNNRSLLAYFSFVDNETGLEYRSWRLVQGRNGPFVSSPFETWEQNNGEKKHTNLVQAAYDANAQSKRNAKGDQYMADLLKAAYAMYERMSGAQEQSGRGPVNTNSNMNSYGEQAGYAAASQPNKGKEIPF